MQKLNFKTISSKFFKTTVQKTEGHQTNPFVSSFKGSFIMADVFEKNLGDSLIKRTSNKIQALFNLTVTSISKIKENASEIWEHAKSIEIIIGKTN